MFDIDHHAVSRYKENLYKYSYLQVFHCVSLIQRNPRRCNFASYTKINTELKPQILLPK